MALNSVNSTHIAQLAQLIGQDRLAKPGDHPRFFTCERNTYVGTAGVIARPKTTEQVSAVLKFAHQEKIGVVPWGGGTGLTGAHTMPDGPLPILLSLDRMNQIISVSADENTLAAEAGVPLRQIQDAAQDCGRLFPLSLASEGSCTVGGVLSTNAGGVAVLRYGTARDLCLGIEAVTAQGAILHGLTRLRKNNTGYDLRHLLIGAEGTLGVITKATLKLFPQPEAIVTAFVALESPAAAVALLRRLQAVAGDSVTAFELLAERTIAFVTTLISGARDPFDQRFPFYVLVDVSGRDAQSIIEETLGTALEEGAVIDAVVAASEAQRAALWRLREEAPIANKIVGAIASHDTALPLTKLTEFIERAGAEITALNPQIRMNCFGHVGDGNLHYNAYPPEGERMQDWVHWRKDISAIVYRITHELGGTFSAEHGVGRLKVAQLEALGDPTKLSMMRSIKSALDPNGIMNPGAVLAL